MQSRGFSGQEEEEEDGLKKKAARSRDRVLLFSLGSHSVLYRSRGNEEAAAKRDHIGENNRETQGIIYIEKEKGRRQQPRHRFPPSRRRPRLYFVIYSQTAERTLLYFLCVSQCVVPCVCARALCVFSRYRRVASETLFLPLLSCFRRVLPVSFRNFLLIKKILNTMTLYLKVLSYITLYFCDDDCLISFFFAPCRSFQS